MRVMEIQSSAIAFAASHVSAESQQVTERLEIRHAAPPPPQDTKQQDLRDAATNLDFKTLMMAWLYEYLTGHKAHIILPSGGSVTPISVSASGRPSWGVSYSRQEVHKEAEGSTFSAQGTVRLKSGQEITFSLHLAMNREQTQVNSVSFRAGNMSDPIVVNFDGQGARLTSDKTAFDLNGDGVDEMIATLAQGSAYLAQDTNGNGKIDSGKELFGPASGNGFSELASLDLNHNGWIDQGDAAYARMGVYQDGKFTSLQDAGIGALNVSATATPFSVKEDSQLLGQVRQSGVYLTEDGQPGALQQIDLAI